MGLSLLEVRHVKQPLPYSPAIEDLILPRRLNPLGPGNPEEDARAQLEALRLETAFAPHPVCDAEMAMACLAGLWLYHNFLNDAHFISQDIHTPTGNYWHGLVHRREPDFNNAAYWFHRVGRHPIFGPLRQTAAQLAAAEPHLEPTARFLIEQTEWDPFAFIQLCKAVLEGQSHSEMLCRHIQQREWELLFDYCYCRAITADGAA
jgi:hypothetical protein